MTADEEISGHFAAIQRILSGLRPASGAERDEDFEETKAKLIEGCVTIDHAAWKLVREYAKG